MSNNNAGAVDRFSAGAQYRPGMDGAVPPPRCTFQIECRGPDGELKWQEVCHNLVTTEGRNHLLDVVFDAATQVTTWYLGLKGTGTVDAADTLTTQAGWDEMVPYSGNRKTLTWAEPSSGSLSASEVSFAITAANTIAGAFVCSNATPTTGTTGVLYNAADFTSPRTVANGDTLNVTPTLSFTAS